MSGGDPQHAQRRVRLDRLPRGQAPFLLPRSLEAPHLAPSQPANRRDHPLSRRRLRSPADRGLGPNTVIVLVLPLSREGANRAFKGLSPRHTLCRWLATEPAGRRGKPLSIFGISVVLKERFIVCPLPHGRGSERPVRAGNADSIVTHNHRHPGHAALRFPVVGGTSMSILTLR